jgi:G3E family GTPase
VADRIVLTKTDLLGTPEGTVERDAVIARLRRLNPAALVLDAAGGEADASALIGCGLYDPARKSPDVGRWLADEAIAAAQAHDHGHHHHHHDVNRHDERVRAFTLSTERAIPAAMLDLFLELLRATHGPKLLRMKAIVNVEETPDRPMVLHGVQHILHPPTHLPSWPDADRRTRMVFIVRDLDPATVRELFDAFLGYATPDRPDAAALVDNPLVPFGGLDHR